MTVPPNFRRNSEVPAIVVLHKAQLAADDLIQERGYRLTTPLRTIVDLAISEDADRDLIEQALKEAQSRGLITGKQIALARDRADLPAWLIRLMGHDT